MYKLIFLFFTSLSYSYASGCHSLKLFITLNKGENCTSQMGHAGISIDEEYYDWGPQDQKSNLIYYLFGEKGRPYDDTLLSPAGGKNLSKDTHIRNFLNGSTSLQGEKNTCEAYEVRARVTSEQARWLLYFWNYTYENKPYFHVLKNQCTNLVFSSLRYAGILKKGRVMLFPASLLKKVKSELKSTCGSSEAAKIIRLK